MLLVLLCAVAGASAQQQEAVQAPAAAPATPGPLRYWHEVREDPPLHLHIVILDLADPRVQLVAYPAGDDPDGDGPWQTTLRSVREIAAEQDLDVAVNANFFASRQALQIAGRRVPYFRGNWARAVGWLVSEGRVISSNRGAASLVIDRSGGVRIGRFEQLPEGAHHVVSGSQQILTRGQVTAKDVLIPRSLPAPAPGGIEKADRAVAGEHLPARAPRTGVGINAEGTEMILLVVDGRLLLHSIGMSESELAAEMLRLGCSDAINLDGGGSSTLVLRSGKDNAVRVMNRPSDGHDLAIPLSLERAVAAVLGARVKAAPATQPTTRPGE
jgi:hypothetical protein